MAFSGKTTAPTLEPLEVLTPGVTAARSSLWRYGAVLAVCALCGAAALQLTSSHQDTAALTQLYAYVPSMRMPRPGHLRQPVAPVMQLGGPGQGPMGPYPGQGPMGPMGPMEPMGPMGPMEHAGDPALGDPAWQAHIQHMQALAQDCNSGFMEACEVLEHEEATSNAGGMMSQQYRL